MKHRHYARGTFYRPQANVLCMRAPFKFLRRVPQSHGRPRLQVSVRWAAVPLQTIWPGEVHRTTVGRAGTEQQSAPIDPRLAALSSPKQKRRPKTGPAGSGARGPRRPPMPRGGSDTDAPGTDPDEPAAEPPARRPRVARRVAKVPKHCPYNGFRFAGGRLLIKLEPAVYQRWARGFSCFPVPLPPSTPVSRSWFPTNLNSLSC